jgi:hypothetical protein
MPSKAIDNITKCTKIYPDLAHAHLLLGDAYAQMNQDVQAGEHYYKAGVLFNKEGDKKMVLDALDKVKKIGAKELEQRLEKKLH